MFFTETLNENFTPSLMSDEYAYTIYESMHSFGSADFLHLALNEFKSKVSTEIKQLLKYNDIKLVTINRRESNYLDELSDNEDIEFEDFIEYETGCSWCSKLTMSAAIFIADNISEARMLFNKTFGAHAHFNCVSVRNEAIVTMFSLAYINGRIVNIFDNLMTLEEAMYHELMHKYVNWYDINSSHKRKKPSQFLSSVMKIADKCNMKDISDIAFVIYALSESEYPSFLAQHKERFENAKIMSRLDFYNVLKASIGSKIISAANRTLIFLDDLIFKGTTYNSSAVTDFLNKINHIENTEIKTLNELILMLIYCWNTKTIKAFRKELIDRIALFKHKLYNIAYDSLSDTVKHRITREYFSI